MKRTLTALTAVIMTACAVEGAIQEMARDGYHAITLLDLNNPLPPEWLQRAGIDYLYVSAGIPIEYDAEGNPVIAAEQREAFERVFDLYRGTGIKVLLMSQFYTRGPEEARAVDFFGRTHDIACFRQPAFLEWMRERIIALARAFGRYEAFGGFMFDDGVHVRVDCCYCDLCRRRFQEQYGVEPPPFAPHEGVARVADDDPVLQWERFQRESFEMYLRAQSEAVRSVSDELLMVTIPSDAYYFGRFLNIEVSPRESRLGAGALLQRIERIHPRYWQMFYTFPMARLPERTETGLQRWAIGNHITAHSARMMSQPEGPYAPMYGRQQFMSPTEIQRMARVSVTEGADAVCFWSSAGALPFYPQAFEALAPVAADIRRIEDLLLQRRPLPAHIGLLYSTTTETFEQPWTTNTNERWRHLHAFEGLAYSLRRSNLPFEVVMEDEITPRRLKRLNALVLPSVRFMTASAASAVEEAIAESGLQVLTCGECLPLEGAKQADCDPYIFRDWVTRGYRQEEHLNEQWREVARTLVPGLREAVTAPPLQVRGDDVVSAIHRLEDGALLVMIVNWKLHEPAVATLVGSGRAENVVSDRDMGRFEGTLSVAIPAADWRILRVRPIGQPPVVE
ncbi:MAG: hypothetical protein J7M38_04850 [Armatimonadetes bacterium]|nr:hypothetical protein [Armatimonadota bacterium]